MPLLLFFIACIVAFYVITKDDPNSVEKWATRQSEINDLVEKDDQHG